MLPRKWCRMRLLATFVFACLSLASQANALELSDDTAQKVLAANEEYEDKKLAVRELLVNELQAARSPLALKDAQRAIEMFDEHGLLAIQSPRKAREIFAVARSQHFKTLKQIQEQSADPNDKLELSRVILNLHQEKRIDLSGRWEMTSSLLPDGARRVYEFEPQEDGTIRFKATDDQSLFKSEGSLKWNAEWNGLAGEGTVVFTDDPSQTPRLGQFRFEVLDGDTLKGSHPLFFWDSNGKETGRKLGSSTLKRLKAP